MNTHLKTLFLTLTLIWRNSCWSQNFGNGPAHKVVGSTWFIQYESECWKEIVKVTVPGTTYLRKTYGPNSYTQE